MTSGNVLTANTWNHVVATYSQDDGYARIYVNGVEKQNSNVGKFASIASPASFYIGRSTDQTKLTVVSVNGQHDLRRRRRLPVFVCSERPGRDLPGVSHSGG